MTPGIQAQIVSNVTIKIDPHPRSSTANGGKIMQRMTLMTDIVNVFMYIY